MKNLLAMLIVVGSLLVSSTVNAEIKTYVGNGSATVNETETQEQVTKRATTEALKNAREQIGMFVRDFAKTQRVELGDDETDMLVVGIIKITDNKVTQAASDDGAIQIRVTLNVQFDTDDLQRELANLDQTKPAEVAEPIKIYKSEGKAKIGDTENQDQTVARATDYALRDIRRQLDIDIRTFARTRKLELTNSEVTSIADKIIKITEKTVEKPLVNYTIEAHVKVTVQVDPADLQREVEKIASTRPTE